MGKGDPRTRKGKIFRGSFGKSRPHKIEKTIPVAGSLEPTPKPAEAETAKPKRVRKPVATA